MHLAFVCVAWASLLFLTTSLLSQQEKEIENPCNDNTVSKDGWGKAEWSKNKNRRLKKS